MSKLVESTDPEICPITDYPLFTKDADGNYVTYTGDLLKIDNVNHNMEINARNPGRAVVYAKSITLGKVVGYVPIEVEICGDEEISIALGKSPRF